MKGLGSFLLLLLIMLCLLSSSSLDDGLPMHGVSQQAPVYSNDGASVAVRHEYIDRPQGIYETARIVPPESLLQSSESAAISSPTPAPAPAPTPVPSPTPEPTPEPTPDSSQSEALPTPAFEDTYKVVAGDTLGSIAHKFYTTSALLAQENEITNSNMIKVGQILKVPKVSATAPPLKPKPAATPAPTPSPAPSPSLSASPSPSPAASDAPETYTDTQMLARMIHREAHWEIYDGKIAVGQCAYDRWQNTSPVPGQTRSLNPGGTKTLSEIITASNQFQLAPYENVCDNCLQAAKDVMNGTKSYPNHIITNFNSTDSTDNWNEVPYIGHIGGHAFYGYKRG